MSAGVATEVQFLNKERTEAITEQMMRKYTDRSWSATCNAAVNQPVCLDN